MLASASGPPQAAFVAASAAVGPWRGSTEKRGRLSEAVANGLAGDHLRTLVHGLGIAVTTERHSVSRGGFYL